MARFGADLETGADLRREQNKRDGSRSIVGCVLQGSMCTWEKESERDQVYGVWEAMADLEIFYS